ncbi:N-acetylmuramoyl-L-alanine amidase [Clostridium sp. Cult1]|uniref:N-acetylmuramoyl-L-alanine amidase n=1 Tax=Clostridium sp. Cult1 TaxID=2079002 RepID=UPI001F2E1322|nr:stage II sporulation protein SpoIID [Clostridium sp. Cult1]
MDTYYKIKYFNKEKNEEIEMPLEKMVGILLNLEMGFNFHIEALKAQAIVLRTNLLKYSKPIEGGNFENIWDSHKDENIDKIIKAVVETQGLVVLFNDKLIDAKYHLACGGSTENSENVIDNQIIYLRRVLCEYCKESVYWKGEKSFSIEEIEDLLKVNFPKMNVEIESEISGFIENIERDNHGRVLSIKIGDESFSGVELMKLLDLNSTRFAIFPTGVKFVSRGKGHGMGLCQFGAEKMAQEGYSHIDILKYYYTGVEIKEYQLPCIKKPLYGKTIVIDPGHGGDDEGHKGNSSGLIEKDIVLKLSLKLKSKLEDLGVKVYLTREKDEKVLITERIEFANELEPDFFMSIHMDYFYNSNMKGCEMFYFKNDFNSKKLGSYILKNLDNRKIATRGIKEGNFYIFRGVSGSSLLIEIGYLSNPQEEILFLDENYLEDLAEGIVRGILEYFTINN